MLERVIGEVLVVPNGVYIHIHAIDAASTFMYIIIAMYPIKLVHRNALMLG